jgi:HPt (histidine-containing phosphotransfer) domain-containing protein
MNDYLAKPIDPQRLGEKLVRWLRLPAPPAAPSAAEGAAGGGSRAGDGLNREAALERLLGNEVLYQRLLQRFGADYGETAVHLEQLLQAGEQDKAIELVHRFKSVAATIGAERLASLAHALEQQWREGQSASDGLAGFTGELRRLLEQLAPRG